MTFDLKKLQITIIIIAALATIIYHYYAIKETRLDIKLKQQA